MTIIKMYSPSIEKLVDLFVKFPTIGRRTAGRFAFYLIKLSDKETNELLGAIKNLKENIKLCLWCDKTFEDQDKSQLLCPICSNNNRAKNLLCLIEKETDLDAIEKTGQFKGLYFIFDAKNQENQLEKLFSRIKKDDIKEVIVALNPSPQTQALALRIERIVKEANQAIKTTHLAIGLPIGGEIEYADPETITSALEGRK